MPGDPGYGLRAHMAAIGVAFLGDDQQLSDRLAGLSHAALVMLVTDLADRIPRGARVRPGSGQARVRQRSDNWASARVTACG